MRFSVPIPRYRVPGDWPQYPFDKMAIGDDLFVPVQRAHVYSMKQTLRARCKRKPGEAYRVDETDGGIIVTRLA